MQKGKQILESFHHKWNFYKKRVFNEILQKNVNIYGETPLHQAARNNDLQKCESIIDHVENKNPPNNSLN